jgi:hypothetical protein
VKDIYIADSDDHKHIFFSLDYMYHGDRTSLMFVTKFFNKHLGTKHRMGQESGHMLHFPVYSEEGVVHTIVGTGSFPVGKSTEDYDGFRFKVKSGPQREAHEMAHCAMFFPQHEEEEHEESGCCVEMKHYENHQEEYCYGHQSECPNGIFRDCRNSYWMSIHGCENEKMYYEAHWAEHCPTEMNCHDEGH